MLAEPLAQYDQVGAAYDAWEHLCADAFDDPSRGAIAVITAYFDASYNQPKAGCLDPLVYTVACYFGTKENWDKVRKEWRIELAKKGLPHFHMKDFEYARSQVIAGRELSKSNPYYGWASSIQFDQFLDRLHRVINRKAPGGKHRLGAFQTEVIRSDFDEARPKELKDDPQCRSYYIFSVSNIMEAIAQWADHTVYYDPIHYIFSGGDREGGNLDRWFNYCWKHPNLRAHFRLGKGYSRVPHSMQYAEAEPALQVADCAAYDFNKATVEWIKRGFTNMPKTDLRKSLVSLARADHFGWVFRKSDLAAYFADVPGIRKSFPVD